MRISDWSSDVCSSDLAGALRPRGTDPVTVLDQPGDRRRHGNVRPYAVHGFVRTAPAPAGGAGGAGADACLWPAALGAQGSQARPGHRRGARGAVTAYRRCLAIAASPASNYSAGGGMPFDDRKSVV